jgi:hypothetical protein
MHPSTHSSHIWNLEICSLDWVLIVFDVVHDKLVKWPEIDARQFPHRRLPRLSTPLPAGSKAMLGAF